MSSDETFADQPEAVRRLMEAVQDDIRTALDHLDRVNVDMARSWLQHALLMLPAEHDGISAPWPTREHFSHDLRFHHRYEYGLPTESHPVPIRVEDMGG